MRCCDASCQDEDKQFSTVAGKAGLERSATDSLLQRLVDRVANIRGGVDVDLDAAALQKSAASHGHR